MRRLLPLLAALVACGSSATPIPTPPPAPVAAVVVHNARIWTGDALQPEVEAVALVQNTDGRRVIAARGTSADMLRFVGPDTLVIDGGGRRGVPAAADVHSHVALPFLPQMLLGGGLPYADFPALVAAVKARADAQLAAESAAQEKGEPTPLRLPIVALTVFPVYASAAGHDVLYELEAAAPGFLLEAFDVDGHGMLTNRHSLTLAGIGEYAPNPYGGRYGRTPDGRISGYLAEYAQVPIFKLVAAYIPRPVMVWHYNTYAYAAAAAGFSDTSDINFVQTPTEAREVVAATADPRHFQSSICLPSRDELEECAPGPDGLTRKKLFLDGAFADGGALLDAEGEPTLPYLHPEAIPAATAPWYGHQNLTDAHVDTHLRWVLASDSRRLVIHAAGGGAVEQLLRRMRAVAPVGAFKGRVTIEHGDLAKESSLDEVAAQQVAIVQNPPHLDLYSTLQARYPAPLVARAQQFAGLLARGIPMGLAGDRFLSPEPLFTQLQKLGANPNVAQRTTFLQGLTAFTRTSAAVRDLPGTGVLEVGARGNLLLLSDDPFTKAPESLASTQVLLTLTDGLVKYSDGTLAPATTPPAPPAP